jgi:transcriptional regulator with XRE-family HTH domain
MASSLIEDVRAARRLPEPEEARFLRRAAGLTQRQIADELGVSALTVTRWEAGTHRPQPRHRAAYARVLDELRREVSAI